MDDAETDAENSKVTTDVLMQALEALNDGIAIYGPDDRPLVINEVGRRRFGSLYKDMVEQGITYREAIVLAIRRARPDASDEEVEARCNQLITAWHDGSSYLTQTEDGRIVKATNFDMPNGLKAAISVDVTDEIAREKELKRARKDAEAASQSKSAFLANMSHDIRTPLNGIMGMAQVMSGTNLSDVQREYMSTILESGKTLMTLLNDVLDLSKIEAGKFSIVHADTDLAHVLRRIQRLWKPRAEEKGLELSLAFDCDLPEYLKIDSTRMQQCVSNLVSNAIKFTDSGKVSVFVRARDLADGDHMIEIEVTDTGQGMDNATLARLFQPFAQADETISRIHGGTGLGLSITRRLAQLMGGDASAESRPGHGSRFTVSFRASPASAQPRRRASDEGKSEHDVREALRATHLRVLLVDDHPINRQVAGLFLRPLNIRIVEAVNGKEALDRLASETFDLVLLDMHMPVMDGPTTIGLIRASDQPWSTIPVVALTADAMSGDKERYLAMGMNGYLSKPLAERELVVEIMRVCNRSADDDDIAHAAANG